MHPNETIINRLYDGLSNRDGAAMAACYHPQARFSDPVFPQLSAPEVGAMWQMLCERGQDLTVDYGNISADDVVGRADWQARYTFRATGRKVHNRVSAQFRFASDKIIEHRDVFSFWTWSRMALGMSGLLLGWTPLVRAKVQRSAREQLDEYMRRHS